MKKLLALLWLLLHRYGSQVTSFVPPIAVREGRPRCLMFFDSNSAERLDDDDDGNKIDSASCNRRNFFQRVVTTSTTMTLLLTSSSSSLPAHARGLVSFPCTGPLLNIYHIMRAGTSLLEEEDIWSTNPLFLTNREAALSETGVAQVQAACKILQAADINPSVMKYSLAASAVDTAMVIRDELKVGQNRLIPEFTFMDPRAIGKWDTMSFAETFPAVVALDELEAGKDGKGGLPPANTDGTPQDTLEDQAIRLRQLMSILETQFSGDNIVLIFPDGSGPALLSAMIAGIPYNKAHVLEFAPGEIRLDVTMDSALQLYNQKLKDNAENYATLIDRGKVELERLRSLKDQDIMTKKDQMMEKEQLAVEASYQKKKAARVAREEEDREVRLKRQRDLEIARAAAAPGGDGASVLPAVIGGVFAASAAVALSTGGRQGKDNDGAMMTNGTDATPSSPTTDLFGNTTDQENRIPSWDLKNPSNPTTSTKSDGALYGETNSIDRITIPTPMNGASSLYKKPSKTEDERKQDAREAMQEYLDQDDGGDAWLQAMADIIDEDEGDAEVDKAIYVNGSDEPTSFDKINGSSENL